MKKDKAIGLKTKLSLIGMIALSMLSCNKSLSREEAEKQIKLKYQFPQVELRELNLKEYAGECNYYFHTLTGEKIIDEQDGGDRRYNKNQYFSQLKDAGLITVNRIEVESNSFKNPFNPTTLNITYNYYDIANFTDIAKQYLVGTKIKLATIEFGEITGIVERKDYNMSEVNYTTRRKDITPFGKILGISEETRNQTISFVKYDDGWRIQ